jgi:hypothetical protein
VWRVAANVLNKRSRTADKVWSSNFVVGLCDYSQTISQRLIFVNVKMDLQEVECGGGGGCMDWGELVQDKDRWQAVVRAVMKHRVT